MMSKYKNKHVKLSLGAVELETVFCMFTHYIPNASCLFGSQWKMLKL